MAGIDESEPWTDDPIQEASSDKFDRLRFAQLVAESIDGTPLDGDSRVFGLIGPWGSGKSSVANLVSSLLDAKWQIAQFTPWAVSEGGSLQLEFAATLDSALGGGLSKDSELRSAIAGYADWATPVLKLIPGVGGAVAGLAEKATEAIGRRKPWHVEYQELAGQLRALGSRVLIVCDDIDRLDAAELLEFLKVVRLLGRFPNVHYLVAYDADTVEELLESQGVGSRLSSFMEKIVQHPFELPAIDWATNYRLASQAVDENMRRYSLVLSEAEVPRARRLIELLALGLRTPRQQIRYEEHLRRFTRLVLGEVDFLDFAALEFLRLNYHPVFDRLPQWAAEARQGLSESSTAAGLDQQQWQDRIRAAGVSVESAVETVFAAVTFLFPELDATSSGILHAKAFTDPGYLERYYTLGVPSNDVSDRLVVRAVGSLDGTGELDSAAEHEFTAIIDGTDHIRARLAMLKGERHRKSTPECSPDGQTAVLRWLAARRESDEPSSVDSPRVTLDGWGQAEILRAHRSGVADSAAIVDIFGEARVIPILLGVTNFGRRDPHREQLFADFGSHFRTRLQSADEAALLPLEQLRAKLSLLARTGGIQSLVGILDDKVRSSPQLFEDVTVSFVNVERWYSGLQVFSEELAFDADLWKAVFSPAIRAALVPGLPDVESPEALDEDDLSEENRRRFGIGLARRIQESGEQAPGQDAATASA